MIYYPLSVLMLAGIRDILIIATPEELPRFQAVLGDGARLGLTLSYQAQAEPRGIAEAILIGAGFIGEDPFALILGDNILFGDGLSRRLASVRADCATVFAYQVRDPERYGIMTFDAAGQPADIVEKPIQPKSNHAVIGLYFYPNDAVTRARTLSPSARGELEITDLNAAYLAAGRLTVEKLSRGYAWFDAGTADSLLDAANLVGAIEKRQNLKIGCIEEIAWRMNWITTDDLLRLGEAMGQSEYGRYILDVGNGLR
jgi:glucose-1-phosphate thymidylyltransferase